MVSTFVGCLFFAFAGAHAFKSGRMMETRDYTINIYNINSILLI